MEPNFVMCMEQIQQLTANAKVIYESKEETYDNAVSCQQHLLDELQQRIELREHLRRSMDIDVAKKDDEISRLENELSLMIDVLEGYRKALKDTLKAFSEYRQTFQIPEEEPIYKDVGGGLVLGTTEIEKQRQKREEEEDRPIRQLAKSF